jgi:hypothetical protein
VVGFDGLAMFLTSSIEAPDYKGAREAAFASGMMVGLLVPPA